MSRAWYYVSIYFDFSICFHLAQFLLLMQRKKKIHKSWIIGFSQRFCQKRAVRFKRHNHASQLFAVKIRWSKQISGIELIYRFRKNHHCFVYLLIVQWISKMMKNLFACSVEHFKTYKYQIRNELHMQHSIFCAWWVFHRIDNVAIAQLLCFEYRIWYCTAQSVISLILSRSQFEHKRKQFTEIHFSGVLYWIA